MATPAPEQKQQALMYAQDIKADILKRLSRRKLLRDSAITATGAVLLPSFLTSCTKEVQDIIKKHIPGGGLGSVPPVVPTQPQLEEAAKNINKMRVLIKDLYGAASVYDTTVLTALNSSVTNESWANFSYDLFIDIALAAAEAMPFLEDAMPAIGLVANYLKGWSEGTGIPSNLSGSFAAYQDGHHEMGLAIDQKLSILIDTGNANNPYPNLKAAWNDTFVFKKENYTVADMAKTPFPTIDDNDKGTAYFKIWNPMYLHHKQSIWNLAIMKCCKIYRSYAWYVYPDFYEPPGHYRIGGTVPLYGRRWYKGDPAAGSRPENVGSYLRGYIEEALIVNNVQQFYYWFAAWDIGIGGYPLPPAAAAILFKDDTPGNIINPDGLFFRSYVFHQFSRTKPDFDPGGYQYHELSDNVYGDFDYSKDEFEFTGGFFPKLTE